MKARRRLEMKSERRARAVCAETPRDDEYKILSERDARPRRVLYLSAGLQTKNITASGPEDLI